MRGPITATREKARRNCSRAGGAVFDPLSAIITPPGRGRPQAIAHQQPAIPLFMHNSGR